LKSTEFIGLPPNRGGALLKNVPVVIHSSLSGSANESHAKRVGADGFVAKFVPDELVREIAKALSPLPVRYGWFHYPSACRGDIN